MFEDFDDREIERLRISWGKDNALPLRTRYELVENRWYPAKIERVKTEVTRGKPRAQVFFDVQGVRLIKDFWLTEKGIFVFKGFLKKFGLCIRDLHDLVSDHRKTYFLGLSPTGHRSRQPRLWRGIGGNGSVQRLNRPQIEHRQRVGERRGAGELIVPPP